MGRDGRREGRTTEENPSPPPFFLPRPSPPGCKIEFPCSFVLPSPPSPILLGGKRRGREQETEAENERGGRGEGKRAGFTDLEAHLTGTLNIVRGVSAHSPLLLQLLKKRIPVSDRETSAVAGRGTEKGDFLSPMPPPPEKEKKTVGPRCTRMKMKKRRAAGGGDPFPAIHLSSFPLPF